MKNAVEQKVAGQEVAVAPEQPTAQIIDLFEALKRSLNEERRRRSQAAQEGSPSQTAARKNRDGLTATRLVDSLGADPRHHDAAVLAIGVRNHLELEHLRLRRQNGRLSRRRGAAAPAATPATLSDGNVERVERPPVAWRTGCGKARPKDRVQVSRVFPCARSSASRSSAEA